MTTIASGHGIATIAKGVTLDVWFPSPALSQLSGSVPAELTALVGNDVARGVSREVVSIEIDISKDQPMRPMLICVYIFYLTD